MGDFKKLRVWKEARELVLLSNNAIKKLPSQEKYLLADQWRRAAYSVPLNIATCRRADVQLWARSSREHRVAHRLQRFAKRLMRGHKPAV